MNTPPLQKNQLQCSEYQNELQRKIEDTTYTGNLKKPVTKLMWNPAPYTSLSAWISMRQKMLLNLEIRSIIPCKL